MHELGILRQVVRIVGRAAEKNGISVIKHITLEIGEESGVVPRYMTKLFPVATDSSPLLEKAELRINTVRDTGMIIKEIGY